MIHLTLQCWWCLVVFSTVFGEQFVPNKVRTINHGHVFMTTRIGKSNATFQFAASDNA